MPAANVVSLVFLDRRVGRFSSPDALARSVNRQMDYRKKWRMGLTLIHSVRLIRAAFGGIRKLIPLDWCLATAVMSNMGEPMRHTILPRRDGLVVAGNMTLEQIEALPPIRPLTCAAFGVVFYAGRLTVSLNYDRQRFTAEDGRDLLESFARRIRASVGSTGEQGHAEQWAESVESTCNA